MVNKRKRIRLLKTFTFDDTKMSIWFKTHGGRIVTTSWCSKCDYLTTNRNYIGYRETPEDFIESEIRNMIEHFILNHTTTPNQINLLLKSCMKEVKEALG